MILHELVLTSLKVPQTTNGRVIAIDPTYTPPLALQLNKKYRELTATYFYNNTTFATDEYDLRTCAQWLSSLTPEHWQEIKTIKCSDPSKWNIIDRNDEVDLNHPVTARTTRHAEAAVDAIYEYSQEMLPSGAEEISLYHDVILVDLRFPQLDGSFVTRWYREGCLEEEEF
jgi:CheY-like chemotaxis protein